MKLNKKQISELMEEYAKRSHKAQRAKHGEGYSKEMSKRGKAGAKKRWQKVIPN
jgi:hypothetical protein